MTKLVNPSVGASSATPNGVGFDVNISGSDGNVFGIRTDHTYNVRNIAAISEPRRSDCLWGPGRTEPTCCRTASSSA
jgi:hypothetical protein